MKNNDILFSKIVVETAEAAKIALLPLKSMKFYKNTLQEFVLWKKFIF